MVIATKKIKQGDREGKYLLSNSTKQIKSWIYLHKIFLDHYPDIYLELVCI